MHPQGGSIWGTINQWAEIALNVSYLWCQRGEGLAITKDHADKILSAETAAAGKESDGILYFEKGAAFDMVIDEMRQKWAAMEHIGESIVQKEMMLAGKEEDDFEDGYGEQVEYVR